MKEIDIGAWVDLAPPSQRGFREAVHIILDGIGHSRNLQARMVMKGGLLLAIRYDSSRFTRDLDFSTPDICTEDHLRELLAELERGLVTAEDRLSYGTSCMLQSSKLQPKGVGKTHQSLALTIGYADKRQTGAMRRLRARSVSSVVHIDYSFNEAVFDIEILSLQGGASIHAYSLHNVLAEKMRSLLQQPLRRRNRRQDVYDLWLLLAAVQPLSTQDKREILRMLVGSCESRGLVPDSASMDDAAVEQLAREGYESLQADLLDDLPPFDDAMSTVRTFYRSLPW